MSDTSLQQRREATHILGELAASRLHDVLAERLQEMTAKGVTQADIARRLGLSEQQVSRWLSQPRNITVKAAGRLLGAMDAHLQFDIDRFECVNAGNHIAVTTAAFKPVSATRTEAIHLIQTKSSVHFPTSGSCMHQPVKIANAK